jgi:hypothetical protein
MNSFQIVLTQQGITDESHSEPLLHALLTYASTDYEGADVESNPVREIARRLESRGVGAIAMSIIRQKLNTLEQKYDR